MNEPRISANSSSDNPTPLKVDVVLPSMVGDRTRNCNNQNNPVSNIRLMASVNNLLLSSLFGMHQQR